MNALFAQESKSIETLKMLQEDQVRVSGRLRRADFVRLEGVRKVQIQMVN